MSNETQYMQCVLKNDGFTVTAWIEEKYAKVGLSGSFKDMPEDERRWEIIEVVAGTLPKSAIDRRSQSFISHANPVNKMRGNK